MKQTPIRLMWFNHTKSGPYQSAVDAISGYIVCVCVWFPIQSDTATAAENVYLFYDLIYLFSLAL